MNGLNEIDKALLSRLKQKIEQLAGLAGNSDLNQKDFDFLLFYIQEKTGQALSLTTVKRIWRSEYQRLPHLSTLNMLSLLAFTKDWHTLKKELLEEQAHHSGQATPQTDQRPVPAAMQAPVVALPHPPHRSNVKMVVVSAAALLVILLLGTVWYYVSAYHSGEVDTVRFSAIPTVDGRIPNSVVFSYDLTGVKADHFYIQQSWDPARKVEVLAKNNKQTDIYYEPGYHNAKLLAGERVLKEIPVHIQYPDWYVRFRYPNSALVKVNESDLTTQGHLGLKTDYVTTRFRPLAEPFQLGYMLSRDFHLPADACELQASVRFDSLHIPVCPMFHLLLKGDQDYAWIALGNIGCESELGLKVGDTYVDGKTNDLSLLGMNVFCWQKIQVKLSQGTFRLSINGQLVREGTYSNALGNLKEIDFFFNGIGSINEINLQDQQRHCLLSQRF